MRTNEQGGQATNKMDERERERFSQLTLEVLSLVVVEGGLRCKCS